jgi:hypothetical protein
VKQGLCETHLADPFFFPQLSRLSQPPTISATIASAASSRVTAEMCHGISC